MADGRWPPAAGNWALAACLLAAIRNPLTVILSKLTDVLLLAGAVGLCSAADCWPFDVRLLVVCRWPTEAARFRWPAIVSR